MYWRRTDVSAIYLAEGDTPHLALDVAAQTNFAPTVWARGYNGSGATIAMLEWDNVDFTSALGSACSAGDNCFTNDDAIKTGSDGEGDHATMVASAATSNHPLYTGMAPGATIVSAGIDGLNRQDDIDALTWAFHDAGAHILNTSYSHCPNITALNIIDQTFDYYARLYQKMIVVAAGNNSYLCPLPQVDAPDKV